MVLKQVIFYIDENIKDKAMKYLKEDGYTLSMYIRRYLIKYVNEKENKNRTILAVFAQTVTCKNNPFTPLLTFPTFLTFQTFLRHCETQPSRMGHSNPVPKVRSEAHRDERSGDTKRSEEPGTEICLCFQ